VSRKFRPPASPHRPVSPAQQSGLQAKFAQGLEQLRKGNPARAEAICKQVLKRQPNHFDALHLLGVIALQTGRPQLAVDFLRKAIEVDQDVAEVHSNLGNGLRDLRRQEDAIASYDKAIALQPDYAYLSYNRGIALRELNRSEDAIASYDKAIALRPDYAEAYHNRGIAQRDLMRPGDAIASYDTAISLRPDYAEAYSNRGNALSDLKRQEDAIASYDTAIALRPDYAEAHSNRGNALCELMRQEDALSSYDTAIALRPDYAEAHLHRGIALCDLKRHEDAMASYDTAIALRPDYAEAYNGRGKVLGELNRLEEAIESFDRAITLQPDYGDAHQNLAMFLLQSGRFERGWEKYEWRLKAPDFKSVPSAANLPHWRPGDESKRLLIWAEQGVGDEILFAGLLPETDKLSSDVRAMVDSRLIPLFERSMPQIQFLPYSQEVAEDVFDTQIPLGSLGRYVRNSIDDFKNVRRGFLVADDKRANSLRRELCPSGNILCGISWKSKNSAMGPEKSMSLNDWAPILEIENLTSVNLQYGDTDEEVKDLISRTGVDLKQCASVDNFKDLDGLAALIEACDIVVTTSNTTAHMAGAIGKDTLLLLPAGKGLLWYWNNKQGGEPDGRNLWYPSIRSFRQDSIGDWASVIDNVRGEVLRMFASPD